MIWNFNNKERSHTKFSRPTWYGLDKDCDFDIWPRQRTDIITRLSFEWQTFSLQWADLSKSTDQNEWNTFLRQTNWCIHEKLVYTNKMMASTFTTVAKICAQQQCYCVNFCEIIILQLLDGLHTLCWQNSLTFSLSFKDCQSRFQNL